MSPQGNRNVFRIWYTAKIKKLPIKNKNPKHINIVEKADMFNNLIKYQLQNLFCWITTEAFLYMTWQQSNRSEPNQTKPNRIQLIWILSYFWSGQKISECLHGTVTNVDIFFCSTRMESFYPSIQTVCCCVHRMDMLKTLYLTYKT